MRPYGRKEKLDIGTLPPFLTAANTFAFSTSAPFIFLMKIWFKNLCSNRRREFNNLLENLPSAPLLRNAGTMSTLAPANAEHGENGEKHNPTNPGFPPNQAMIRVAKYATIAPFSTAAALSFHNLAFLPFFSDPRGGGNAAHYFSGPRRSDDTKRHR